MDCSSSLSLCGNNRIVSRAVEPHVQRRQRFVVLERTSLNRVQKLETHVGEVQILQDESQSVRVDRLMVGRIRIKIARCHNKIFGAWCFQHDQPSWSKNPSDLLE